MVRRRTHFGLAGAVVLLSLVWTITTAFAASAQFEGQDLCGWTAKAR